MSDTSFGVGMTIKRLVDGVQEPIKDRRIEKRVNEILSRDIEALQRRHDDWMRQAEREREKRERIQVKGSNYKMRFSQANKCLQMARAYAAVISRILEEDHARCSNQNGTACPTRGRRITRGAG